VLFKQKQARDAQKERAQRYEATLQQAAQQGLKPLPTLAEFLAQKSKQAEANGANALENSKLTLDDLIQYHGRQNEVPDFKDLAQIESALSSMSTEELGELISEAAALPASEKARVRALENLIEKMIDKDPKLGLNAALIFYHEPDASFNLWSFENGFGQWCAKNPSEAEAWLEDQLADGKLTNKSLSEHNSPRIALERAYLKNMLSKDKTAVETRLAKMDIDQKDALWSGLSWRMGLGVESQAAYLSLLRGPHGPKAPESVLNEYSEHVGRNGSEEQQNHLLTLASDDAERLNMAKAGAQGIFSQQILHSRSALTDEAAQRYQQFVLTHAPQQAEEIFARHAEQFVELNLADEEKMLANLRRILPEDQADAVKLRVIEGSAGRFPMALAESISDAALRTQATEILQARWRNK
jgi:hypothetical protein